MSKNYEKLLDGFKNPSSEFNPVTMWFWNGKITKEGITKQLEEFREQGVYEFFIHPTERKEVEYLSDEFMNLIRHSVDEAKRLGMKLWIYDETDWPSGSVGGLHARKYPELRQKELWCIPLEVFSLGRMHYTYKKAKFIRANRVSVKNGETYITDVTNLCEVKKTGEFTEVSYHTAKVTDEKVYLFFMGNVDSILYAGRSSYGIDAMQGYIDMLSEESCAKFIELTHERYKEVIGDEFGKTVMGVFTDEPTTLYHFNGDVVRPWTTDFAEKFEKRNGYSILPYLHTLFVKAESPHDTKVRTDYYNTMKDLYHKNFCGQISKWCSQNNLKFTGHFGGEEWLGAYIAQGDMQTEIMYMDVPGIDEIGCADNIHNDNFNVTGKLVAGAAKYADKDRTLSETYTCCRWDYTISDMKRTANRILGLGANMIQYMGAWYSIDSERWDGPAYSYQNSLYKHFNMFNSYLASVQYLSAQTKPDSNVLMFIPLMQTYKLIDITGETKYDDNSYIQILYENTINALLYKGIEYDLISENLAEMISVHDGAAWIRNYRYDCIILPGMEYTNAKTAELIKKLEDSGVKIIFVESIPEYVAETAEKTGLDYKLSHLMSEEGIKVESDGKAFFVKPESLPVNFESYGKVLGQLIGPATLNIESDKRVYIAKRRCDDCEVYFIHNDEETPAKVSVDALPGMEIFSTDTREPKECIVENGRAFMTLDRYEMAVALRDVNSDKPFTRAESEKTNVIEEAAIKSFDFTPEDGNYLGLQFETFDEESQKWYKCEWYHGEEDYFGLSRNLYLGNGETYRARATFNIETLPEKMYFRGFVRKINKVLVNGNEVKCDINIRKWSDYESKTEITKYIKQGENVLELECVTDEFAKYRENSPFVILTGDFGVDDNNNIVSMPTKIGCKGWEKEGFPYYSGDGVYTVEYNVLKPFKKATVKLCTDDVAALYINGEFVTRRAWAPYTVDVTEFIKQGENEIKICVTSAMGNTFMKFRSPSVNGLTDAVKITLEA